jgi:tetratricopeptide (TPR) repeat protein
MSSTVRATLLKRLGEAIELDSTFAEAHASRAHILLDSVLFDRIEQSDWLGRRAELVAAAEAAASRAATLNPGLGSAHGAMARLDMYAWRLTDAKAALERAAAAGPNDASVPHWSTLLNCLLGNYSEAVRSARRAIALDPRNPAPYSPLSMALLAVGDVDGAVAALEEMIDVAPTAALGYISLARMEVARGNGAAAVEALRLGELFLAAPGNLHLDAAMSYARLGRTDDAERLVAEFKQAAVGRHVDPGISAWAELALGRYAEAMPLIQTASAQLESGMDMIPLLLVRLNAWSDPVLEQPEWVLRRAGLEYRH